MMDIYYEIFVIVFFLFGKLTARKTKTKEARRGREQPTRVLALRAPQGIEHKPDLGGQKEGRER